MFLNLISSYYLDETKLNPTLYLFVSLIQANFLDLFIYVTCSLVNVGTSSLSMIIIFFL